MNELKKKILVIDDDARNIFALTATLRAKGFQCLTASGAQEGLDLLAVHEDIGMVLIDMMMPDMDGYEAIPLMKANPKSHDTPVIAVTAQAMLGDREKCLAAGADDYVSKPVDVDKLMHLLKVYLK